MIKYIVTMLTLGITAGYLNNNWVSFVAGNWVSDYFFNASLMLLLFIMGVSFSMDEESIMKMRRVGVRIVIVPFAIASGSILAGLVSGLILGINVVATMAVSAGYGWYTLAGPLVGQLFGAEWGTLGFATNFLRELLTITTISLTCKAGKSTPIAFGGATTMDTTLPVIVRYCGSEALIASFSSGFILSLIAPFTIMMIATISRL